MGRYWEVRCLSVCRRRPVDAHGLELVVAGDPAWARAQGAAEVSGAVRRELGVGRVRAWRDDGVPHPSGVADILERGTHGSFALSVLDGDGAERLARPGRGGGGAFVVVVDGHCDATTLGTRGGGGGGGRSFCVRGRLRGRLRCHGGWYGRWREAAGPGVGRGDARADRGRHRVTVATGAGRPPRSLDGPSQRAK